MHKKKKHSQFNRVDINSRKSLHYGGVVIPAYPSYYWGISGGVTSTDQTQDTSPATSGDGAAAGSGITDGGGATQ